VILSALSVIRRVHFDGNGVEGEMRSSSARTSATFWSVWFDSQGCTRWSPAGGNYLARRGRNEQLRNRQCGWRAPDTLGWCGRHPDFRL